MEAVREKVRVIMEAIRWKPFSNGELGGLKMPKGRAESWPSENKIMRLAFHDCLKYTDGTGGCDGCLNLQGAGWKYMNFFEAGIKPQSNVKPKYYYDPSQFDKVDNNDLEGTVMALELIYKTVDWPPSTPVLPLSLFSAGKSRSDLWSLAGMFALERSIERANYACDHDFHVRQQIPLLEGREKCDIKLTKPIKFRTGRSDCVPTDPERPYSTNKEEDHPLFSGNTPEILDFLHKSFGFSDRDSVALMGIHSVIKHRVARSLRIAGFKYTWIGSPYLTTIYYKMLANRPLYSQNTQEGTDSNFGTLSLYTGNPRDRVAVGDSEGNPIQGFRWRAHCNTLWNTTDGGPCFWRPSQQDCPEGNPAASTLTQNCWNRTDSCCADAFISEQGVQSGGCAAPTGHCGFNLQFAMHMEVGMYHNFSLSGPAHSFRMSRSGSYQ